MITARDIMHSGATCIAEHATLATAAEQMRDLGIGALPICGDDYRLHGIITDRDIVVKCLANGHDPTTMTAGELAQNRTYYVDSGSSVEDVLAMMEEHQVRRMPVIDDRRLVGVISEADIARHLPEHALAEFVEAICAPPALGP